MNEYTRREEVRWTFIASTILVLCIAIAVIRLVRVQGNLVPDVAAQERAQQTEELAASMKPCAQQAEQLLQEMVVFNKAAAQAKLAAEPEKPTAPKKKPTSKDKEKETLNEVAWGTAAPSHKLAIKLAQCRERTETAVGERPAAAPAWNAVLDAAKVPPPGDDDKPGQVEAARKLHGILGDAKLTEVHKHVQDAEAHLKDLAAKQTTAAATAMVREPLPTGVLSRQAAVGIGVALCVLTLLLSYISVSVSSSRRATVLIPLRDAARQGKAGLQAAAILRIAAAHNGGEPGLVIGAAMGGLLTALLAPAEADVFVLGVMGGLLFGLGVQWAMRIAMGPARWRGRATELAELEKPTTPIVLVLSTVNPGLEPQFLQFFKGLSTEDAAMTVEKLAAQAEEKILAAADANRM
ncbi:MAG: hypothetical protein R3B70_46925 [Polyangiaceae bacterium]